MGGIVGLFLKDDRLEGQCRRYLCRLSLLAIEFNDPY
jgi:hypothetical protein